MKNNKESVFNKFVLVLVICSAIIALSEGFLYYDAETYPNVIFRCMLSIQNCIKAFEFDADIGLQDIVAVICESNDIVKSAVGYAYALALFSAPYCTLFLLYKVMERIFKIRSWRYFPSNARRIVIFGYNDEVKALLRKKSDANDESEKRRIHLVSSNISEEDEIELIKNRIILHKIECLDISDKQLGHFAKRIELEKAKDIILFEESAAKNFSLCNMLHTIIEDMKLCNQDVKFFCRCEDDSIKRIMEDYYDTKIRDKKEEKDTKKREEIKGFKDLEIVSIPELRIRKMLKDYPLHSYHMKRGTKNIHDWNLHLLIVGFGKLGQQLLLQAMSQGVVSTQNDILIDVVDFNIDEKRSIFANNFDNQFVEMNGNEYVIPSEKEREFGKYEKARADGTFKIRFHQMDIRYKQFYQTLLENGQVKNGGLYTYIAICVSDANVSLHCMSEVEKYLRTENCDKDVSIGIRIETDRQMACYLNANQKTFSNVFAIEGKECAITMDELLQDKLDKDAKEYNYTYNTISIMTEEEYLAEKKEESNKKNWEVKNVNDYWREQELFRRNSSRALASHNSVKEEAMKRIEQEDLDDLFGKNGKMLKHMGDAWIIEDSMEEFVKNQSDGKQHPYISELSKLEHRRWTYFMASCGWRCTDDLEKKKDDMHKENPCMCTWDDLVKYHPYMCCYDLMPLLLKYIKSKNNI